MLCIKEKIKCIIVSPSDDDGSRVETNNSLLASALGVEIIKTPKNTSIQSVVETVINKQKLIGEKPYYIYGDSTGTGNEYIHMSAYVDVAKAIVEFEEQNNLIFDAICLAVGTGSTYAGLTMGLKLCQRDLPVVGFTIARPKERCETALNRFYDTFNLRHGTKFYINKQISDIALGDGYGKITQNQRTFLSEALKHYAIAFDETYVGKAFWGMYQEMYQGHLKGNILFIHTGSLPLVFDALHKKEVN
jgi:D-cysteine desulfhydrase